jgi:hypothetical protein
MDYVVCAAALISLRCVSYEAWGRAIVHEINNGATPSKLATSYGVTSIRRSAATTAPCPLTPSWRVLYCRVHQRIWNEAAADWVGCVASPQDMQAVTAVACDACLGDALMAQRAWRLSVEHYDA